jgi:predicted HicB family RNase H-like nuclease
MEYNGYQGRIEFDAEACLLHGDVLNIRDVVTFQGQTLREVL